MSDTTKIQWADATFNPVEGCTKVSPGCANCYAAARNHRFGMDNWGPGKPRRRTSAANWKKPVKWNQDGGVCVSCGTSAAPDCECGQVGALGDTRRRRVFPSLCDWLDDEWPIEVLADFLRLIYATPNLDWLLLTKRPENWSRGRMDGVVKHLSRHARPDDDAFINWLVEWMDGTPPANIWLGVSVEDQRRADERIPELLAIPARVRFLSVEPMLESVDLKLDKLLLPECETCVGLVPSPGIDWVIVGGESGPGARDCQLDWLRVVVMQCRAAAVPCFVKQLGSRPTVAMPDLARGYGEALRPFQIKHPKGGDPAEWPEALQVREFPKL